MSQFLEQVLSFLAVVAFSALGGFLLKLLQGVNLTKNMKTKPLCSAVTIPPLVGMIVFGCIANNFFGESIQENYPNRAADWTR
jgi:hypothetical protein